MKKICYSFILLVLTSPSFSQTWQKMTSMPGGARDGGIIFSINNKIYSGGGGDYASQKDFYEYDITAKTWTKKANIPGVKQNRGFAAGFSINGKGYVGLGSEGIGTPSVKHDLWEYDPALNTWTQKADYPGGNRDGVNVFIIGDKVYIGGGLDSADQGDQQFYEYDPSKDTWTQKADLPIAPIIFASGFTIGKFGYIACPGVGLSGSTDVWRYDPAADSWDQMQSFPGTERQACIAFVLNGKGYIGSGQDNYSTVFTDMYSYDPVSDSWKKEADFGGSGRGWPVSITVGDTVYVGNGASFTTQYVVPVSDWWIFTPTNAGVSGNAIADNSQIHCYPQPASSYLQLSGLNESEEYSIKISDALGRTIFSQPMRNIAAKLDISILPKGVNNLILSDNRGKILSIPFLKE